MQEQRTSRTQNVILTTCATLLAMLGTSCGPQQAYPGPKRPADEVAILRINPPQAQIGFQLVAVNDRPIQSEVVVSLLPGSNKLSLQAWPTSASTFRMSDPAFAEHYQMIDEKFQMNATVTFVAEAGVSYGLNGTFNEGSDAGSSSYGVTVFELDGGKVDARGSSANNADEAAAIVDHAREADAESWSVEAGPGS